MSNQVSSHSLAIKQPKKNYSVKLSIFYFFKVRGVSKPKYNFVPFYHPQESNQNFGKATVALQPTRLHPWGHKVIYMVREFFELLLICCHCGSLLKTG